MTSPADAFPPEPTGSGAAALRAWGLGHPSVTFVLSVLPRAAGGGEPPGLYADSSRTPWVSVKDELRVSLLRVFAVTANDSLLVGQLQVTERLKHSGVPDRRIRCFVHDPSTFVSREVASVDAWWLEVLERYYALGGKPLDLESHVYGT